MSRRCLWALYCVVRCLVVVFYLSMRSRDECIGFDVSIDFPEKKLQVLALGGRKLPRNILI